MVVPVPGVLDGSHEVREWESRHPEEVRRARKNPGERVICPSWFSKTKRFLRFLGFNVQPSRGRWKIYFQKEQSGRMYLHSYPAGYSE